MKPRTWIFIAALATSVACASAQAPAHPALDTALRDNDIAAVAAVAADRARPGAERALAQAAVDYWQRRDARAGAPLQRAAADASLAAGLRGHASIILSGLRLRQTRYGEALAALDAALAGVTDTEMRADLEQTRSFIAPLVDAPPMQVRVGAPGNVTLTRDANTLLRAQVAIDDGTVDAIVDTGSGVSTLSLGAARRLGVRMLTGQASIGTATSAAVTTGLAIADKVRFGDAEFRNVVFLVLPDEALSFANGAYVVRAIIGLPLLMPLGRLEFTKGSDAATETLHYGPSPYRPDAHSNLLADGVEAIALAHANDNTRTLRLFIDNGATHAHLNRRFVVDFPEIAATGQHQAVTTTGGAGSETQQDAMRLPSITLRIGDGAVSLTNVAVTADQHPALHGAIGLDTLEAGRGYVLDFDAMRLEVLH